MPHFKGFDVQAWRWLPWGADATGPADATSVGRTGAQLLVISQGCLQGELFVARHHLQQRAQELKRVTFSPVTKGGVISSNAEPGEEGCPAPFHLGGLLFFCSQHSITASHRRAAICCWRLRSPAKSSAQHPARSWKFFRGTVPAPGLDLQPGLRVNPFLL